MRLACEGMDVLTRNNVVVSGRLDGPPMVLAHGFGCDQGMWRHVAPAFEGTHQVVLFDHVGAGGSDLSAWDPVRYRRLDGYAEDVLEILQALDGPPVVFPVVRGQRDPGDGMAGRMTVFSLTLLLVPTLGLVWVRYVWQEADAPGVTLVELLRRTGLILGAGLVAYLMLRLAAAAVSAAGRGLESLDRRMHPWRY